MKEEVEVPVFKGALKTGAIVGLISIILTLVIYLASPGTMAKIWYPFLTGIIFIVIVTVLGVRFRNSHGGYMTFGQAFLFCLITFAISGLIGTTFSIILHHVIDTGLADFLTKESIKNMTDLMSSMGAPQAQMEEELAKKEGEMLDAFSVGGIVKGYFLVLIGYAVVSLITGLIVKKNEPIEDY